MKAKELISQLQKLVDENGDLEVDFVCPILNCTCRQVSRYCYCGYEDKNFYLLSIDKKTLPKCEKMTTVGITFRLD